MRAAKFAGLLTAMLMAPCMAPAAIGNVQTLPGLIAYQAPKFPMELRGVKSGDGYVVMVLTVDAQGKVSDSIALAASHDAFVRSASEAMATWRFAPVVSTTLPRRETIEIEFRRAGVVTAVSHAEAAREGFVSTNAIERRTMQWHELDAEPTRISAGMPAVSKQALGRLDGKPLLINFIIDDQGRVRVPVISTDDPGLSDQVLAAVRQWRYAPPLHHGKPVAVEVTRALVLPGAGTQ